MNYQILSQEVFNDFAKIVEIFGQGCNYPTKLGVDGFQVYFKIKLEDETQLDIIYQSDERTDNITAYNGYEMTTAGKYGVDADQSNQLWDMQGGEEILDELQSIAEDLCLEFYKENFDEYSSTKTEIELD